MALYTTEVDIEVDLGDFDADELVSALEGQGFIIFEEKHFEGDLKKYGYAVVTTLELDAAAAALRQGRREEGLILLERAVSELKGLLLKG